MGSDTSDMVVRLSNRSQDESNLSFPHVLGGNLYFFRPMDARLKHSGMAEAIISLFL